MEKVAHADESLLSLLREGKIPLAPELTSGLLSMVDAIRTMLDVIQASGQDGDESYPELIETLKQLQQPAQKPKTMAVAPPPPPEPPTLNSSPLKKDPKTRSQPMD